MTNSSNSCQTEIVKLVGLHDAADGPEDVTFKEIFDEHFSLVYGTSLKAR